MQQKTKKTYFTFEIIASQLVTLDSRFYWRTYLWSGVNMLTNSLKISYTTKTKFFELTTFQNKQKIWEK